MTEYGGQEAVDELVSLLDLERLEVNLFRGVSPDEERQRVFGGQVAGQALVAAGRTVDPALGARVHSLHAYFLRPGDTKVPIIYEVDRSRDGRSFITRRVVAIQHGQVIFHLQASFHTDEPGYDHQEEMPDVPDPETIPSLAAEAKTLLEKRGVVGGPRPIDLRHVSPPRWMDPSPQRESLVWIRADGKLPDDAVLHTCVAAYASDMTLLDVSLAPHGQTFMSGEVMMASLDHAMWFHRPFRADEWLLYHQTTPNAHGGLGLSRGEIFTREGQLAMTVMQEGLIRPIRPKP